MIEFAVNNNNFLSAKLSLFFASKSLYLCISFDIVDFSNITTHKYINKSKTIDISEAIQAFKKYTKELLTKTQTSWSNQINKNEKEVF